MECPGTAALTTRCWGESSGSRRAAPEPKETSRVRQRVNSRRQRQIVNVDLRCTPSKQLLLFRAAPIAARRLLRSQASLASRVRSVAPGGGARRAAPPGTLPPQPNQPRFRLRQRAAAVRVRCRTAPKVACNSEQPKPPNPPSSVKSARVLARVARGTAHCLTRELAPVPQPRRAHGSGG